MVVNKEENIEMYRQQIDQEELSSGQATPRIFVNEACAMSNNVPYTGSTTLLLTPPNHRKGTPILQRFIIMLEIYIQVKLTGVC